MNLPHDQYNLTDSEKLIMKLEETIYHKNDIGNYWEQCNTNSVELI